jgi:hypothetical protein
VQAFVLATLTVLPSSVVIKLATKARSFIKTMAHSSVDYLNTFFEFPVLDKIHGEPTFPTLTVLKKQLKANSQSVTSDLGGGQFGHLGLVLTDVEYAFISNVPYIRPAHPGTLAIPANTAQHEAIRLAAEHKEAIRLFRETIDLEKVLKKQIVAAVNKDFLDELRNNATDNITQTVSEVLTHLFATYGQVDPDKLRKEEEKLETFVWNLRDPPIIFYNAIEELVGYAIAAGLPKSPAQVVNFGIGIVRRTNDFEMALTEWFQRPIGQQIWADFKTHFTTAHNRLKRIRGPTMSNTPFQQANQLAAINTNLENVQTSVLASIQDLVDRQATTEQFLQSYEPAPAPAPSASTTATMNATVNAEILTLLQQMQTQMANMQVNQNNNGGNNGTGPRNRRRTITNKYCWSHGGCNHTSAQCRNKKQGHQDAATFTNRMEGSNDYCRPATTNT